ncbi:hypothetical protein RLT57_27915 [Streptomyces sp. ITFR-21]|nr:hypothetical protein [Streptomyces sp. ITFR-21]WNI18982.1 hypothetical protein RLT57_27915 [Streptomyces sp. ITFR-21]
MAANSRPTATPYHCSYWVSKVAAETRPDGIWVTPPRLSPTPAGPSPKSTSGTQSDGMPMISPMQKEASVPCSIETFWAGVICPVSWATRVLVAAVELSQRRLPGAGRDGGGGTVAVTPPTV